MKGATIKAVERRIGSIWLCCGVLAISSTDARSAPAVRYITCGVVDTSASNHETGFNYITPFAYGGDTMSASTQSPIMIFENDRPLGPAHSLHADIRSLGGGRFSHWGFYLYLSSSDGSDPSTNGRTYTFGVPAGQDCPIRAAALTFIDQSETDFGTFQSHNQKVVSNSAGYFMTYLMNDGGNDPSDWRLAQSQDGGRTFKVIWDDAEHATRAPALETDGWYLYLAYPDWSANASYILKLNPHDGTSHLTEIPGALTWAKFSAAYDSTRSLLYYAPIQGSNQFYTYNTETFEVSQGTHLLTPGPNAEPHYPNLAVDGDGTLFYGWTTSPPTGWYRSNQIITSPDGGVSWSTPGGEDLALPIVGDETGPSALVTSAGDIDDGYNWMDNMLPWMGKIHFVYTTDSGLRYVRFPYGANAPDLSVEQLQGETIKLGGLGTFFSADAQTGYLYVTGHDYSGRIACLISRDNGDSWHDFALSAPEYQYAGYAAGGARQVTADGKIIGSFTDGATHDVYFIRIEADRTIGLMSMSPQ